MELLAKSGIPNMAPFDVYIFVNFHMILMRNTFINLGKYSSQICIKTFHQNVFSYFSNFFDETLTEPGIPLIRPLRCLYLCHFLSNP